MGGEKFEKMKMDHPVLLKPIREIPSSKEFQKMAELNHFENLLQIVQIPVYKLERMPTFSYRMLVELISILETHNLQDILIED